MEACETVEKYVQDFFSAFFRADIRFRPFEIGEYSLFIKFNGYLLPFCPLKGLAGIARNSSSNLNANAEGATGKVRLTGVGLIKALCNEDNYFLIDGSKAAKGNPTATLSTSSHDVAVSIRAVAKDVYEAVYHPHYPGNYLLNVTWAGRLVKGCPLKITADDNNPDTIHKFGYSRFTL